MLHKVIPTYYDFTRIHLTDTQKVLLSYQITFILIANGQVRWTHMPSSQSKHIYTRL